jgi:hypothetical protein
MKVAGPGVVVLVDATVVVEAVAVDGTVRLWGGAPRPPPEQPAATTAAAKVAATAPLFICPS